MGAPGGARLQRPAAACATVRMAATGSSPLAQFGDRMTTLLVDSPLYPIMVQKARATMKQTAEGAGIVRVYVDVHSDLFLRLCW